MAASVVRVPRLVRQHDLTKQWVTACGSTGWSPRELLDAWFPSSLALTVKRSSGRFFMYEEHSNEKINDDDDSNTKVSIHRHTPNDFSDILCDSSRTDYHYWTSPIRDVAPSLLKERLEGYASLHSDMNKRHSLTVADNSDVLSQVPFAPVALDPRGPSLWVGSSGSATQAHYDVADNVIVQLHGNKRIRLYPPSAACALHVFPDAHSKARKSQVNFDDTLPDSNRYPHFSSLSTPTLDVVLQPGDALQIPAFWFHHLENGQHQHQLQHQYQSLNDSKHSCNKASVEVDDKDGQSLLQALSSSPAMMDGPSVSLNIFALSAPMQTAQIIFRDGSAPFPLLVNIHHPQNQQTQTMSREDRSELAAVILRKLGWALLKGIGIKECPNDVIRRSLLDTRYRPLGLVRSVSTSSSSTQVGNRRNSSKGSGGGDSTTDQKFLLASLDTDMHVETCIAKLLQHFDTLKAASQSTDTDGIVLLVMCHLLELWAVELVGASEVGSIWERALALRE